MAMRFFTPCFFLSGIMLWLVNARSARALTYVTCVRTGCSRVCVTGCACSVALHLWVYIGIVQAAVPDMAGAKVMLFPLRGRLPLVWLATSLSYTAAQAGPWAAGSRTLPFNTYRTAPCTHAGLPKEGRPAQCAKQVRNIVVASIYFAKIHFNGKASLQKNQ